MTRPTTILAVLITLLSSGFVTLAAATPPAPCERPAVHSTTMAR